MEKKTILIKVAYLVDLPENREFEPTIDKITSKLSKDKNVILDGTEIALKWESTSAATLSPDEMNCGKCENCGRWITDKEDKDAIAELCNGATFKGKLLCDECLPKDHRWAF